MNFPDLIIEVSRPRVTAMQSCNGRHLNKHFSRSYSGLADLITWMRDLEMKGYCIRIRIADRGVCASAANLAVLLGMGGHIVSIGGSDRCLGASAANIKTSEATSF